MIVIFELVDDLSDIGVISIIYNDNDGFIDSPCSCNAGQSLVEEVSSLVGIDYDGDVEVCRVVVLFKLQLSLEPGPIVWELPWPSWSFSSLEVVAVEAIFVSPLNEECFIGQLVRHYRSFFGSFVPFIIPSQRAV